MKRIHLIAPAGSLRSFLATLNIGRATELIAIIQAMVGDGYSVTANEGVLDAEEDECSGGRRDDAARANDITAALADADVRAVVALRGGAWFTRILPHIDFSVLDRRSSPVAVFGFSELTPLVNIVAGHRNGRGYYDMGPAFLVYGLRRHATVRLGLNEQSSPTPDEWMRTHLHEHMADYFRRVIEIVEGRGEPIELSARLVRGELAEGTSAAFVGGNLTVFSTLIGSRYAEAVRPKGKWIVLEDFNDKPERIDRFLSHLTLSGFWERCEGLLLGDFHQGDCDLGPAVLNMLNYHLPQNSSLPVLVADRVGHVWPMTPLPLHRSGWFTKIGPDRLQWRCDLA